MNVKSEVKPVYLLSYLLPKYQHISLRYRIFYVKIIHIKSKKKKPLICSGEENLIPSR